MSYIEVQGGKKLSGVVHNQSAKNSALALLCASLMIRGKTTLTELPVIDEVGKMLVLLQSIGVKIDRPKKDVIVLDTSGKLNLSQIDKEA